MFLRAVEYPEGVRYKCRHIIGAIASTFALIIASLAWILRPHGWLAQRSRVDICSNMRLLLATYVVHVACSRGHWCRESSSRMSCVHICLLVIRIGLALPCAYIGLALPCAWLRAALQSNWSGTFKMKNTKFVVRLSTVTATSTGPRSSFVMTMGMFGTIVCVRKFFVPSKVCVWNICVYT